jgi:hypothetical protein
LTLWFSLGLLIAEKRRGVTPPGSEIAALRGAITSSRRLQSRLTGFVAPP